MNEPLTPTGWANLLHDELAVDFGAERFPVDVERLALEYTRRHFEDPITRVIGEPLDGFEGALFPSPSGKPRWLIAYNSALPSEERIRYTKAHEFGHYLLHRRRGESIRCRAQDMWARGTAYERREVEANRFASKLLMPTDDYRRQVERRPIDLRLFRSCAGRYGVSLTAAILEWLVFTPELAMLVCARDGFIDWAVSSNRAWRKGAFVRTRDRPPVPVPEGSLAARAEDGLLSGRMEHPRGVWLPGFAATEFAVASERYDMTLSLLLLSAEGIG